MHIRTSASHPHHASARYWPAIGYMDRYLDILTLSKYLKSLSISQYISIAYIYINIFITYRHITLLIYLCVLYIHIHISLDILTSVNILSFTMCHNRTHFGWATLQASDCVSFPPCSCPWHIQSILSLWDYDEYIYVTLWIFIHIYIYTHSLYVCLSLSLSDSVFAPFPAPVMAAIANHGPAGYI